MAKDLALAVKNDPDLGAEAGQRGLWYCGLCDDVGSAPSEADCLGEVCRWIDAVRDYTASFQQSHVGVPQGGNC